MMFGLPSRRNQTRAPLTAETVEEARELVHRGKQITAIKRIREQTGMGLAEAKAVADDLEAGRDVPIDPAPGASLADRARELRARDRIADAVRLVATETGMSEAESARFLDSLE